MTSSVGNGRTSAVTAHELRHRLGYAKRMKLGKNYQAIERHRTAQNGLFAVFFRNKIKNEQGLKKNLEKNRNFKIFDHLENILWDFQIFPLYPLTF